MATTVKARVKAGHRYGHHLAGSVLEVEESELLSVRWCLERVPEETEERDVGVPFAPAEAEDGARDGADTGDAPDETEADDSAELSRGDDTLPATKLAAKKAARAARKAAEKAAK